MHRAAVWHHSSNSKIKIVHIPSSISCGIHLISLLMMSSLLCGLFSQTLSFRNPPQKIVRQVEILGKGWSGVIGLMQNEPVPWEVARELFKCSVREMGWHLLSRTEHLNRSGITSHGTDSFHVKTITPGHPLPKISTRLTNFWGGVTERQSLWKQSPDKLGHHQKRNQIDSTRNGQWSCEQF